MVTQIRISIEIKK